jgi:hypothetical protein
MHLAHPRVRRAVQLCLSACALLTGMAYAGNVAEPLQLVLYTPLNVDGGATTASTTLQLYNPNAAPLKYTLSIQNAKSKNTNGAADWVVTFYGADNKPAGPILEGTVAAKKSVQVRVDLSHVMEAGETTAEIKCNNVKIADLKVVKDQGLPFRVSLEGNPAEKPEIEFVKGSTLDLRLKNDDAMSYPLLWEFLLKGRSVSGTTILGPNGSTKFTVAPDDGWFSLYQSFFKSEAMDGTLTLGYKPLGAVGAYPSKTIPIKARLSHYDPATRDRVAMVMIILILAFGGGFSVYVNVDLVNRIKAISINKRVGQLARVIGEIQPQLNSQLRVSLWLERGRITATLPHLLLFTPETDAVLAQSDVDTDALKVRVDLAAQIQDAIIRQDHAIDAGGVAPSLMEKVTKNLSDAQDLLKKSVLSIGEKEKVQSLIGNANNILEAIGQPDDELEKGIAARLQDLKAKFTPAFLADGTCVKIKAQAPIPFSLLHGSGSQLGSQAERDTNTRKLAVIADLVQMQSTNTEILECLRRQDLVSLPMAEQLLRELKDGVSLDALRAEITANPPQVYFTRDRDQVRVNTPFMMKLMFNKWRYNRAAARRRIECTWDFHDNLTEKGWEVYHYFAEAPKKYCVKVTFKDLNQVEIVAPKSIEQEVSVSTPRDEGYAHAAVELQRWAVGFLVALVGLFAGAKDKILTLDTAGAIFAVFLLGFGIDMAKNLLVSKQSRSGG